MVGQTNGTREASIPRLAGLAYSSDGFYLFGDSEKRAVDSRPVWYPIIIHEIQIDTPYYLLARSIEPLAIADANAFTVGFPVYRYKNERVVDAAVQFHHIAEDEWQRSRGFAMEHVALSAYFGAQ